MFIQPLTLKNSSEQCCMDVWMCLGSSTVLSSVIPLYQHLICVLQLCLYSSVLEYLDWWDFKPQWISHRYYIIMQFFLLLQQFQLHGSNVGIRRKQRNDAFLFLPHLPLMTSLRFASLVIFAVCTGFCQLPTPPLPNMCSAPFFFMCNGQLNCAALVLGIPIHMIDHCDHHWWCHQFHLTYFPQDDPSRGLTTAHPAAVGSHLKDGWFTLHSILWLSPLMDGNG